MKDRNNFQTRFLIPLQTFVYIFNLSGLTDSSSPTKSFHEVAFPLTDDRLCAVDSPAEILTISELEDPIQWPGFALPTTSSVPASVLCANRCTSEPNCTDFVFRSDVQQCHLYYQSPTACNIQQECSYYTVSNDTVRKHEA
jgi:hypothetical protein